MDRTAIVNASPLQCFTTDLSEQGSADRYPAPFRQSHPGPGTCGRRDPCVCMRDVLHIFTFMENHNTFSTSHTKYENVKNVPQSQTSRNPQIEDTVSEFRKYLKKQWEEGYYLKLEK